MPPVMFSVVTKYHKGRHSLFLYNSEIFYAFTQDILRSRDFTLQFETRKSFQNNLLVYTSLRVILCHMASTVHRSRSAHFKKYVLVRWSQPRRLGRTFLAKLADWHGACFLKLVNYQKKSNQHSVPRKNNVVDKNCNIYK